jgi:virulence-associated protein VapD
MGEKMARKKSVNVETIAKNLDQLKYAIQNDLSVETSETGIKNLSELTKKITTFATETKANISNYSKDIQQELKTKEFESFQTSTGLKDDEQTMFLQFLQQKSPELVEQFKRSINQKSEQNHDSDIQGTSNDFEMKNV